MATQVEEETEEQERAVERSRILSHIDRYNLSGEIEPVRWNIDDGELVIGFVSPDNTIIGTLQVDNFNVDEEIELGVMQTSRLQKLIKILNDQFDISFQYAGEQARVLVMEDGMKTVEFRLSDLSVIPETPSLKRVPDFQVEMDITEEFADDFRSAESALDSDEFAVRTTPQGVEVVVGYTADSRREHNNKVTLPVSVGEYESFSNGEITFKADTFAEILKANSDAESGTWSVSEEGLSQIQFENENWNVSYYFVSQQEV
jgi:hypothetical protein